MTRWHANCVRTLFFALLPILIPSGSRVAAFGQTSPRQGPAPGSQVTVPSRPATALHKGELGEQGSEIEFTSSSRTVTLKLMVEDPNGYFVPNIRRENFAVYEDGVRQKNVTVEIEHAPVSLALLMELGGHYHELDKVLGDVVPAAGRQLLEVIGRDDKIAIFKYDAKLDTLVGFNEGHDVLDAAFSHLSTPGFSEANFYDALMSTLNQMKSVTGRRAIIVISSGIDTFSAATYQEVLQIAQSASIPIYAIGLGHVMQQEALIYGPSAPFARIDWNAAEKHLEELARVSGGRAYELDSTIALPGIYDDIMENLRVRYVITYVSSNEETSGPPRKIRVELVDPSTNKPLIVRDSDGKTIQAKVFVQETYSPNPAGN